MPDAPRPPVQRLSAREAGLPADEILFDGVPEHLRPPLQDWTRAFLNEDLAVRVALRLRVALPTADGIGTAPSEVLAHRTGANLLDAIDMALQLDDALHIELATEGKSYNEMWAAAASQYFVPEWLDDPYEWQSHCTRGPAVERLDQLLVDGGSAYHVDWRIPLTLTRRVDPTVAAAAAHTVAAADVVDPLAGDLLRDAWRHAYGLHPDPDAAYRDAVRAVEQIVGPMVLPKSPTPSLGTVRTHLSDAGHKWSFALLDQDGAGTVDPVVALMDRLWTGQVSRHGGGPTNRKQTQAEAEAAVHLAATLIQLLSTDALTRREKA